MGTVAITAAVYVGAAFVPYVSTRVYRTISNRKPSIDDLSSTYLKKYKELKDLWNKVKLNGSDLQKKHQLLEFLEVIFIQKINLVSDSLNPYNNNHHPRILIDIQKLFKIFELCLQRNRFTIDPSPICSSPHSEKLFKYIDNCILKFKKKYKDISYISNSLERAYQSPNYEQDLQEISNSNFNIIYFYELLIKASETIMENLQNDIDYHKGQGRTRGQHVRAWLLGGISWINRNGYTFSETANGYLEWKDDTIKPFKDSCIRMRDKLKKQHQEFTKVKESFTYLNSLINKDENDELSITIHQNNKISKYSIKVGNCPWLSWNALSQKLNNLFKEHDPPIPIQSEVVYPVDDNNEGDNNQYGITNELGVRMLFTSEYCFSFNYPSSTLFQILGFEWFTYDSAYNHITKKRYLYSSKPLQEGSSFNDFQCQILRNRVGSIIGDLKRISMELGAIKIELINKSNN